MATTKKSFLDLFGNYPKEYNRAIHGPYYPWVNYGLKDTPIWQVKLGELKPWLARRNKKPYAAITTISRYSWLYVNNWVETRYGANSKFILHLLYVGALYNLLASYNYYRNERKHKYHW